MRYFEKALIVIIPLFVILSSTGCSETTQDQTKPIISNVNISNITETSATVSWITNQPSRSVVLFGTSTSTKERTVISDQQLVTNHNITLTNLESNNTYYLEVLSENAEGNTAVSTSYHFMTLAGTVKTPSEPSRDIENIKEAAQVYLNYEKSKQWDAMWSTLHPDSQALFGSKDEFIQQKQREENDNGEVSLKSFAIVNIEIIPQWTFASEGNLIGTDKTYSNVAQIQVLLTYSTPLKDEERSWIMHSVNYNSKWTFLNVKRGYTQSTNTRKIVIKYSRETTQQVGRFTARWTYTYLILTLDIENQGCDSFRVTPSLFQVVINSIEYSSKSIKPDNVLGTVDLLNGEEVTGKIVFEIPKIVVNADYRLVYNVLQPYDIEWIQQ